MMGKATRFSERQAKEVCNNLIFANYKKAY
jgi:hypothetical protein